jgi:hypothetical protein
MPKAHLPKPMPKAHLLRIPKPKLLRSNPNRFTSIRLQGTGPYDAPDDEYLCSSTARKPRLVQFQPDLDDDEELSDYVKTRLLIARVRAIKKYQENQG